MIKYCAIDIETTSLDWTKCGIVGIGCYSKVDSTISFSKELPDNIGEYECIYHNGSFDQKILHKAGLTAPYTHDTILMASLLQFVDNIKNSYKDELNDRKLQESLALDNLAIRDLGIKKSWKINWAKEHPTYEQIREHNGMDVRVTYFLFEQYKAKLEEYGLWGYYNKLLMPLQRLLVDVECTGIRLDVPKLLEMKEEYSKRLNKWSQDFQVNNKEVLDVIVKSLKDDKINKVKDGKKPETKLNRIKKIQEELLEFNVKSHIHMGKLLKLRGINLVDKSGEATTASKLLWNHIDDPIIAQIVSYKKDNKIYKDFLCKWDEMRINEILYTNFRLWATRTGRLSSAEPNLQQVPKDSSIRELFIPRAGFIYTVADAKQLEARLAAYFSKEEALVQAFKDGVDVYQKIADDLGGLDRTVGKQLFLASIYGQGTNSLYYILTKEHGVNITLEQCKYYKRLFNKQYAKLQEFSEEKKAEAERNSYITTWFGRRIYIPRDKSYKAINSYVQGSGSDLIGFSQLNIGPKLQGIAKLLLLVHDEVVYEHKPEDTKIVVDTINKYMVQSIQEKYGIPMALSITTGDSWGIKE